MVDPQRVTLQGLDLLIVGLFVAAILALGFSVRLREHTFLQFFAAGRTLTLPFFVATLVSTWYGGILGIGESVSYFGLGTWLLLGVPYYCFALLYALWLAPRVRRAEHLSIPERLSWRFGKPVGLVGAGLVFLLAVPAAHVLMLGVLVQTLSGMSLLPSLLVGAVVGTMFLYRGGLLADVRVALLAFLMMYVGFATIAGYCLTRYPLGQTMQRIENPDLLTIGGGAGWLTIVSFFILGAWTIVDPGFHQRVASSASPETGRKGVLVSVGFWFLFDALSVTTGMYALALLDSMPENPLAIFPLFGEQILPPGLKAVFFCGMLGTILTAMVGYTLVSGATFGRDIVLKIRGNGEATEETRWTRIGLFVGIGAAIGLASQIPSVVQLWYSWSGIVVGALLIPLLMSYSPKARVIGSGFVLWSMVLSATVSAAWLVYGLRTGNAYLNVRWLGEEFSLGTLAPGLAVSGAVLLLGGILGKEESE